MRLRSAHGAQAAVLVAAACAGALVAAMSGSAAAPTVRYQTTPVAAATVSDTISATGTVAASATVDLAFGATNQPVTAVLVHSGERVRAGQLLATVDDKSAEAALASAQASVDAASAAATNTTDASASTSGTASGATGARSHGTGGTGGGTTVCRTTTVTVNGPSTTPSPQPSSPQPSSPQSSSPPTATPSPSPSSTGSAPSSQSPDATASARPSRGSSGPPAGAAQVGTTRTTRTCTTTTNGSSATGNSSAATSRLVATGTGGGSATSLSNAEQALTAAEAAVAATRLTAPQAGVVSTVDATVGTLPGTPAIEIRTTTMSVQVPVQEQDAPYVQSGQAATINFAALGLTGTGVVAAAPLEPNSATSSNSAASAFLGGSTQAVVTYPVTITITDPPPGLLPGMSATVNWTATTREGVLAIPTSALQGADSGTVVRVLVGSAPRTVPVSVGLSTSSLTEVTAGLRAGDQVITGISTH